MCDIIFENTKCIYAEATVQRVLKKRCYKKFRGIHKKTSAGVSFFDNVKLCRSAASLKTRPYRRVFLVNFLVNIFLAEHHQTTGSDYISINSISNDGRIGKRNCKLWYRNMRGDRGHNSAVGSRRSKANQSWELVEIGIDRGNTNWSLKQESVVELRTSIRNIHLEQYSEIIIWKSNLK